MNRTFQVIRLLRSCLVVLTQIFVNCNRFNKGDINEIRIEWTLKRVQE